VLSNAICGLLGVGTGIFVALSLLEKPVWALMRDRRAHTVHDVDVQGVHVILRQLVPRLPPAMIATMSVTAALVVWQADWIVAGVFLPQLGLIVLRLRRDIRGVSGVSIDASIALIRDGVGALALLHHRGLLMTASTLIVQWTR